jgi:hypothetical protein
VNHMEETILHLADNIRLGRAVEHSAKVSAEAEQVAREHPERVVRDNRDECLRRFEARDFVDACMRQLTVADCEALRRLAESFLACHRNRSGVACCDCLVPHAKDAAPAACEANPVAELEHVRRDKDILDGVIDSVREALGCKPGEDVVHVAKRLVAKLAPEPEAPAPPDVIEYVRLPGESVEQSVLHLASLFEAQTGRRLEFVILSWDEFSLRGCGPMVCGIELTWCEHVPRGHIWGSDKPRTRGPEHTIAAIARPPHRGEPEADTMDARDFGCEGCG